MAIDEALTNHVRRALTGIADVREVKMFGGVGFMLRGNLAVAASSRGLLVRVGAAREADALARPGTTIMTMNGRRMNGYVQVAADHLDARTVKRWVALAREHVEALPAKKAARKRKGAHS